MLRNSAQGRSTKGRPPTTRCCDTCIAQHSEPWLRQTHVRCAGIAHRVLVQSSCHNPTRYCDTRAGFGRHMSNLRFHWQCKRAEFAVHVRQTPCMLARAQGTHVCSRVTLCKAPNAKVHYLTFRAMRTQADMFTCLNNLSGPRVRADSFVHCFPCPEARSLIQAWRAQL